MNMSHGEPSLAMLLGRSALRAGVDPDKVAVRWEHGSRTYAELRDRALRLAGALRSLGLSDGDRVATLVFNRGEIYDLYFACAFAGLTFVPISFRLTPNELAMIMRDCSPSVVFVQEELEPVLTEGVAMAGQAPLVHVLGDEAAGERYDSMAGEPLAETRHTDVHMILYTSGTTGRPKGVAFRHLNILWFAFQQAALRRRVDDRTVTLIWAPTYNTGGINEECIPTFLAGGTVTMMPSRGWSAARMAAYINRWKVSHCVIVPSLFRPLLDEDDKEPLGLASLRWVLTGGENCPPALMNGFRERWPHVWLTIAYGSTESGYATFIEDADIPRHPASVGRPAPGQSVIVASPDGDPLPPGQVGEVWTAGPSVISQYWDAPELNAETMRGGWLKMGDLGRFDDQGHLYIVGRSKDLIISKSHNIYPAEIEAVLKAMPELADVTVLGVPDPESGEAVCAVAVRAPGSSVGADEIVEYVRKRLASYKKPKHVLFHDSLPRNATGKVVKNELRERCVCELGVRAGGSA